MFKKNHKIQTFNFPLLTFNFPRSGKAFTIIELLVSITIIMIIVGFTFAGYTRFNQRQKLIAAGQTMRNIVRDVQSRAFSGELDCSNCDCSTTSPNSLKGWYVDFSSYSTFGVCRSNILPNPDITFTPQSFSLEERITVAPHITPATQTTIKYSYYPPSVDTEAILCLSQENYSQYYQIIINKAGSVSDSSGLSPACP